MLESLLSLPPPEAPFKETTFLGEVASSSFITGSQLATQVELTAGIAINENVGWLKFYDHVDRRTKYIAKRSLRHTISWDQLNYRNLIYGNTTVVIAGSTYRVRLLKGAFSDPTPLSAGNGYDAPSNYASEWNRLLYRVTALTGKSAEGIVYGDLAKYTEADLGTHTTSYTLCQETYEANPLWCLSRGYDGVTRHTSISKNNASLSMGWRPVLELIS